MVLSGAESASMNVKREEGSIGDPTKFWIDVILSYRLVGFFLRGG